MKRRIWPVLYGILLCVFTLYVLLDAFVIPRSYAVVSEKTDDTENTQTQSQDDSGISSSGTPVVTENSYDGNGISITITTYREYDTEIYVADVTLSDASLLGTAFALRTYGKNITEKTSSIAAEESAVLAVNGDYYSARSGYVIRNGTLYRSSTAGADQEDLVIDAQGNFEIIREGDVSAEALLSAGAEQVLSFGPALVESGSVCVSTGEEVDRAMTSNPRTAIGMITPLHYVFVVSDGRTEESEGLSVYQLACFMQSLGAQCAYNLDGGGSSTMVFCGEVVNQPTTNGNKIGERAVSDIVYIG